MIELFRKYKKALAGAVTAGVTYIVVTKLGASPELAAIVSAPVTGLVVGVVRNVFVKLDELLENFDGDVIIVEDDATP